MNTPAFENLDLACAQAGKNIAEKPSKVLENLVTGALAVLEEQGIYALFLFLKTQDGSGIEEKLTGFLRKTPRQAPVLSGNADICAAFQEIATDLDKLLLARDIVRQALIYARYHARVTEKNEVGP
jgi:hypothetical protein